MIEKQFMTNNYRFYLVLLCVGVTHIAACNPVPLSVVAADFSINGVAGTGPTSTGTSTSSTSTTSAKTTSTTTGTNTTGTSTTSVQNVTIDLTSKEICSTLTSLVTKVVLDEGVKISPDPAVPRDYTNPVTYTVTETYGEKVTYSVTVKGKACASSTTTSSGAGISTTPLSCTVAPAGNTGYSLVFKACDTNLASSALYYDKTECVRDNATGLIWEGKTAFGLRAGQNKYNNLDSTNLLQVPANNVPGTTALAARAPVQAEIDAPDNAIGYKNNVNALKLCGASNWRLPTKDEQQSIRIAGTTTLTGTTTQIDLNWFLNTNFDGYYTTSTQFGTVVERSSVVQFGAGTVDNWLRDGTVWQPTLGAVPLRENSVRLVRSAF